MKSYYNLFQVTMRAPFFIGGSYYNFSDNHFYYCPISSRALWILDYTKIRFPFYITENKAFPNRKCIFK